MGAEITDYLQLTQTRVPLKIDPTLDRHSIVIVGHGPCGQLAVANLILEIVSRTREPDYNVISKPYIDITVVDPNESPTGGKAFLTGTSGALPKLRLNGVSDLNRLYKALKNLSAETEYYDDWCKEKKYDTGLRSSLGGYIKYLEDIALGLLSVETPNIGCQFVTGHAGEMLEPEVAGRWQVLAWGAGVRPTALNVDAMLVCTGHTGTTDLAIKNFFNSPSEFFQADVQKLVIIEPDMKIGLIGGGDSLSDALALLKNIVHGLGPSTTCICSSVKNTKLDILLRDLGLRTITGKVDLNAIKANPDGSINVTYEDSGVKSTTDFDLVINCAPYYPSPFTPVHEALQDGVDSATAVDPFVGQLLAMGILRVNAPEGQEPSRWTVEQAPPNAVYPLGAAGLWRKYWDIVYFEEQISKACRIIVDKIFPTDSAKERAE